MELGQGNWISTRLAYLTCKREKLAIVQETLCSSTSREVFRYDRDRDDAANRDPMFRGPICPRASCRTHARLNTVPMSHLARCLPVDATRNAGLEALGRNWKYLLRAVLGQRR
jgi:hypothetical protein